MLLVVVGTWGRFYPLASSHTHRGLLDTVNTKLEVHFHSLFMIYHEECAEEKRQSKVPAVGKSWCVQLSGWERGTDQWSG